jgi:regulatory protein
MLKKTPREYALYLIEMRDRSVFEIEKKMRDKGFAPSEIKETIKFLLEKQFLDDDRFVRNYVAMQVGSGRVGKQKLLFKLSSFKVDRGLIDKYVGEISKDDEYVRAEELAQSWLKKKSDTPREKIYERLGRFLLSRGFGYDIIKPILDRSTKKE